MSNSSENLAFSEEALGNRTLFLSEYNDVNIFVEDVGKEYIYEEIFERLFDDTLKVYSIFPLGGKKAVIEKQSQLGLYDNSGKANVFIVDGDFDNLWTEQKVEAPNLIYLRRYNIESYYCTKDAVIRFMRRRLRRTRAEVEQQIKYDDWLLAFKREALPLFSMFAIVQRYALGFKGVSKACGNFMDSDGHTKQSECEKYEKKICERLGPISPYLQEVRDNIIANFDANEVSNGLTIICGKYQLESLCRYLTQCCGKNIPREEFTGSLISDFDLTPLTFLKQSILELSQLNSNIA